LRSSGRRAGNGLGGPRGGGARQEALPRVVQRGGAMPRGAGTLRWRASTWCASRAASARRLVRRRGGAWEEVARRARPGGGAGGRKMDIFCEDSESRWKTLILPRHQKCGAHDGLSLFHGWTWILCRNGTFADMWPWVRVSITVRYDRGSRPLTCGSGPVCR
jgi:hypothetical protein